MKNDKQKMKEPIVLIKAIRDGCFSDDVEVRKNSKSGFKMEAGTTYQYSPPKGEYPAHYYCGTHIIYEEGVDWSRFIEQSKYYILMDRIREGLSNK